MRSIFLLIAFSIPILAYLAAISLNIYQTFGINHIVQLGLQQILLLLIISPLLEEIVFRGLIQEYLATKINSKFYVIIIVNVLFSGLHYHINHNPWYLFCIAICGIIFSIIKLITNSLSLVIMIHSYYNLSFLAFAK